MAVMSILYPIMSIIEGLFFFDTLSNGLTTRLVLEFVLLASFSMLTVVTWFDLVLGYRKRKEGPRWSERRKEDGAAGWI
jgi:hypothetical protein